MGKIIAKHHTWAPGAKKFAFWLANVDGLDKVIQGNIRNSHVKAGVKRNPDVQLQANAVLVTYYRGGMIQRFFAHPVATVTVKGAARRIRIALKQLNERGGVGQSSKADIAIPEHIVDKQRRSEMESQAPVPVAAAPPLMETEIKTPVGAAGDPVVFKSTDAAAAYAALLAMRPSGAVGSFQMSSPQPKLAKVLGSFNRATYAAQSLKAMGLLVKGSRVAGTSNTFDFTVSLRPYKVEPRPSVRSHRSSAERASKTQPVRHRHGSGLSVLVRQLEDAHGSVQRLTTLIHDQGFTVSFDKDGKVKLGVK